MDGDFRTTFVRDPAALRHYPALVLNADYRPLSYYPLSLWPWQEAVKAAYLDRVSIVAEYDHVVRSQRAEIRIPSVVVLKDYVKPQKRVAFTRFNLFLRDQFCCQYCGAKGDLTFDHVLPRSRGGITSWDNVVAACSPCNLRKGSKTLLTGLLLFKWSCLIKKLSRPMSSDRYHLSPSFSIGVSTMHVNFIPFYLRLYFF
jgi:5-methylcytosine-specific restriction endonuclease McrA